MTTWYVIDTRLNEIVSAIKAHDEPEIPPRMPDAEHLRLDADPPSEMLTKWRGTCIECGVADVELGWAQVCRHCWDMVAAEDAERGD